MRLVREHINEKFELDSDPVDDMQIGQMKCPYCNGEGYTLEHNIRSIDPDGHHDCSGCPIQVPCEKCQTTGIILKKDYNYEDIISMDHVTSIDLSSPNDDLPF